MTQEGLIALFTQWLAISEQDGYLDSGVAIHLLYTAIQALTPHVGQEQIEEELRKRSELNDNVSYSALVELHKRITTNFAPQGGNHA